MRRIVCVLGWFVGRGHAEAEIGVRALDRGRRRILMLAACVKCGRVRARFPKSDTEIHRARRQIERDAHRAGRKARGKAA